MPVTLLGSGGMGRVTLARDRQLRREVALKRLHASFAGDPALVARFLREAEITARLEHPGIVPIYDFGLTAGGDPWYAMRRIRGRSLDDAVSAGQTGLVRRVLAAAEAVAFAHSRGIVHRDLKPANIMLGEFGETLVVDWGLARSLDDDEPVLADGPASGDGLTRVGAVLGTPEWMSPEQARGEPADRRSDVYGLGATLYFVLEGRPPKRSTPLAFSEATPPDLAALCTRALAHEPDARYADADGFKTDLERWLDGQRVSAYTYSTWELLRRLTRRFRVPLTIGATALVALAVVGALSVIRIQRESSRARSTETQARGALASAEARLGQLAAAAALDAQLDGIRPDAELLATTAIEHGAAPTGRGALMRFAANPAPTRLASRGLTDCRRSVLSADGTALLCLGRSTTLFEPPMSPTPTWTVPLDATRAAVGRTRVVLTGFDGQQTAVLDRTTGQEISRFRAAIHDLHVLDTDILSLRGEDHYRWTEHGARTTLTICDGTLEAVDLASDGRIYAVCRDGQSHHLRTGRTVAETSRVGAITPPDGQTTPHIAAVAPTGRQLALGNARGDVWIVDTTSGETRASTRMPTGFIQDLHFDGHTVAVSGDASGAILWHPGSHEIALRLPQRLGDRVWLSGETLLTWNTELLRQWRVPPLRPHALTACPGSGVTSIAASPDGRSVWTSCGNGAIRSTSRRSGELLARYSIPPTAKAVALSPDGERVAAVTATLADGLVRRTSDRSPLPQRVGRIARRAAFLPGGDLLVLGYSKLTRHHPDGSDTVVRRAGFRDIGGAPDRSCFALAGDREGSGLWTWHSGDPSPLRQINDDPTLNSVDAGPNCAPILTASAHRLSLHSRAEASPSWTVERPDSRILDIALSPDGRWVATGGTDGRARLHDATDGHLVAVLNGHHERVSSVVFGPEDNTLLTGSWDDSVRQWSLLPLTAPTARADLESRWDLTTSSVLDHRVEGR